MRKKFLIGVGLASILIVFGSAVVFKGRQTGVPDDVSEKSAPAQKGGTPEPADKAPTPALYKIGRTIKSESEQDNSIIYISVDPQHFTRDKMVSVARQLNHDFPDEKRLSVTIFDNEESARKAISIGNQHELFEEAKRGYYYLNRVKKKEYIEFSTKPERPANEIKVTLSPSPAALPRNQK